jgi:hypothetical protein
LSTGVENVIVIEGARHRRRRGTYTLNDTDDSSSVTGNYVGDE